MLYDRWRQIAREFPDELALHDTASARRWTFAQLAAAIDSCSSRVDEAQISFPQGNTADFILAVLRAWRKNQIVCPLEPGQSPPFGRDALPRVLADRQVSPTDRIIHLKTTSATSSEARLVAFTAEQLAADAGNIVATMGLRRDWPNLGVISLAHSYGFSNLVTPLLLHGIPLILAPAPLPETVRLAAALAPDVTLPAVPAMWRAWHAADSIPANVKLAISAGAPLPLALEQEIFTKRGLKIHNFYGTSECGGIAYDASEAPRTDAACVGSPMKNVELSVADGGCLEVRSRAVAESYLEDGELKIEDGQPVTRHPSPVTSLGGGCFLTSDLAEISSGLVYLRGRSSDLINVAGRKVSPETVERVLLQHPQVSECLVFGVPSRDAERTEEIVAVIVSGRARHSVRAVAPNNPDGAQETDAPYPNETILRRFVLETLPAWQTPRHWLFVEALQTNPRGKISRAEWRQHWLADQ